MVLVRRDIEKGSHGNQKLNLTKRKQCDRNEKTNIRQNERTPEVL